jgi:hypothetical protein
MLLRSLSAVIQSLASKPMLAVDAFDFSELPLAMQIAPIVCPG